MIRPLKDRTLPLPPLSAAEVAYLARGLLLKGSEIREGKETEVRSREAEPRTQNPEPRFHLPL